MTMKNPKSILVLALFFSLTFGPCLGQEIQELTEQSIQEKYDFHYSKHKKLRKTGFILLGVGVASMGAGALIANNADTWSDEDNLGAGAGFFTAGLLTTISSVPVFIVSGSHKRKAKAYVQAEYQMKKINLETSKYVSLGVRIEF